MDASARRVEQAYQRLTLIIGFFAVTLAFTTILTSIQIGRLIRKRLAPLHDGAKIVANGDLSFRIKCEGSDEFAELALSINTMTDKLQVFTKQLEAEISAHKQAAIALRNSEAFANAILDSIPNEIAVIDNSGIIMAANNSWRHFAVENGIESGKAAPHTEVGNNYLEICLASAGVSSEGAMDSYDGILAVIDGRLSSFSLEYPCHSPNQQRWFNMTVTPLEFVWRGVVIAHTDITERKRTEERINDLNRDFVSFLENTSDFIYFKDENSRIRFCSQTLANITGHASWRDMIGKHDLEVFPKETARIYYEEELPIFREGKPLLNKIDPYFDSSGNEGWVSTNKWPLLDHEGKGKVVGLFGISRDITKHKRMEEELRRMNETLEQRVQEETAKNMAQERLLIQQSRLAAMGEMIGNIAHQWRQPLNALGLLIDNIKDANDYQELDTAMIDEQAARGRQLISKMSTTIDDFRNFFKPNKKKQSFLASDGVEEAVKLVSHSFRNNNIEITQDKSAETCHALGYPNEFAQVVLNALSNAKEAIIGKKIAGKVHIKEEIGENTVTVSIRDNGGGIPEEIMGKVFDPYFTTKEKGTGIGLYMSKMIMEHMDGNIDIRNVEGGAEVLLTLPLAMNSAI